MMIWPPTNLARVQSPASEREVVCGYQAGQLGFLVILVSFINKTTEIPQYVSTRETCFAKCYNSHFTHCEINKV